MRSAANVLGPDTTRHNIRQMVLMLWLISVYSTTVIFLIVHKKSLFVREQKKFVHFVGYREEICQIDTRQRGPKAALSELD